jgi:hypothetical protein
MNRGNVQQACPYDNPLYISLMQKTFWILLLACMAILGTGCKSDSGSREYIPGKGWKPTR